MSPSGSPNERYVRAWRHSAGHGSMWLAVSLQVNVVACQRPISIGAATTRFDTAPATATPAAKPSSTVSKQRFWDGSVGLRHRDGTYTIAAWPMQLGADEGGASPMLERCERIAKGAPYLGQTSRAPYPAPKFDELATTVPRYYNWLALDREEPCAEEFGPNWRVPSLAEFNAYAAEFAQEGAWIVRLPNGQLSMVDYTPALPLRLAAAATVPARTRPALDDSARLFCLKTTADSVAPVSPSRSETEHCVRKFFVPVRHGTATVDLPEQGLPLLLAVRLACRDAVPVAEWLSTLDALESRIHLLANALTDRDQLGMATDEKTEYFVAALLLTMRRCIEQIPPAPKRSHAAAFERLDALETSLRKANLQREELLRRQPLQDRWQTPPQPVPAMPAPAHVAEPKPKRCGCAQGDLACTMRCAAKGY